MGHFDGIEKTKIFDSGVYLNPDQDYKLKILNTKVIKTREKGRAFIADLEVLESSCEKDPVGEVRNLFILMDTNVDTAFSNICAFLVAALGVDYATPDGKRLADAEIIPSAGTLLDEATEKNTLAGKVVRNKTSSKMNKAKTAVYTRNHFSPG